MCNIRKIENGCSRGLNRTVQKPQPANTTGQVTIVLPCQPLLPIPCGLPWVAQTPQLHPQTPEVPHNSRWSEGLGAHRLITLHGICILDSWMLVEAEHLKTSITSPVSRLMQPLSCPPAPAENLVQQQLPTSVLQADSSRVRRCQTGRSCLCRSLVMAWNDAPPWPRSMDCPSVARSPGRGCEGDRAVKQWT